MKMEELGIKQTKTKLGNEPHPESCGSGGLFIRTPQLGAIILS